jgi:short-subunit dehydrogenase
LRSMVSFIRLHDVDVSVLINNAGFGDHAPFEDADIKKLTSMIDLNCTKLVELTHAMVPLMPKNSYIMNVASLAGFMPGPLMSVYYATKAFVLSFSQALAYGTVAVEYFFKCACVRVRSIRSLARWLQPVELRRLIRFLRKMWRKFPLWR